jgi:hypothetical protein
MIMIFAMLEEGLLRLVSSEVLVYENEANPFAERRSFVTAILKKAEEIQKIDERVLGRAQQIEKSSGIKGIDALHLACAEGLKAVVGGQQTTLRSGHGLAFKSSQLVDLTCRERVHAELRPLSPAGHSNCLVHGIVACFL